MKAFLKSSIFIKPIVVFAVLTLCFSTSVFAQIPANNAPSGAVLLTSAASCSNTNGTLSNGTGGLATGTTGINNFCTGTAASADVWYYFVAQSSFPTVALSNMASSGSSMDNTPGLQIFNTNSTNPSIISTINVATLNTNSSGCVNGTSTTTLNLTPASGLTIGNVYLVRVMSTTTAVSTTASRWSFRICVTDPAAPANESCGTAATLTSAASCSNTTGTLNNSKISTGLPAGCESAGAHYDVWYKYVATKTSVTITLSGLGSNFTNPEMQIYSGSCGLLNSMQCGTNTLSVTGLALTNTYFIRISNVGAPMATNGGFSICITDPPANDECSGVVSLTSNLSCSNTTGTLNYATPTAGLSAGCEAAGVHYDAWYSFVATSSVSETITLSGRGTNFTNPEIQLYIGTCGALTSAQCGTNSIVATGLTVNATYYVRVSNIGTPISSNGGFSICVTHPPLNDNCAAATSISSSTTCFNTQGSLTGATYVSYPTVCAGTANNNDVWYSFTANSTNPTITLSSNPTNSRFQVFSGNCTSPISAFCSSAAAQTVTPALTIGNTYLVRVFSTTNATGTFNICITDPVPANNLCSGATTLTPAFTCNNISGSLYGTTVSASPTISGSCAGTVTSDVWYSFVASYTYATISMSNVGSDIVNPGIELLSGSCTSMFSLSCGAPPTMIASSLIVGNTYYVRIYSTGPTPTSAVDAGFNICITYTAPLPPSNDECAGAVNLPVNGSCSNTTGTVNSATASTGIPTSCTAPAAYDVWYKFTAINGNSTTITTSSFGVGFAGTQRMELYSGTCGSLSSLQCGTSSISRVLTQGTTYYVRIYTTTAPAPTINGDFKICISTTSPPPRIGNSYVNLTKNTVGGVVQNGDILEIRMTIVNSSNLYSTRYLDNIPTNTQMMSATTDSIRIITNEGLTYRRYTPKDNVNDDAATYMSSPGSGYNIKINLGQSGGTGTMPAAPTDNTTGNAGGAGNLPSTGKPVGGGGIMFATSFRVKVTGAVGDTITLNGGRFLYRTSAGGSDLTLTGFPYKILITDPLTLCANSVGVNNASETGGTFGSGTFLNRNTDLANPIAGYSFVAVNGAAQVIGDGQYALINNTSPFSGTNSNAYRNPTCPTGVSPDLLCDNRMFGGYWYIKGDHSGTNNSTGNTPAPSGNNRGYMLAVNADYVASEAYRQTLTGLCPNTYYEFSAWLQNICAICGIDSVGNQFSGTVTSPANGYPGVYPNLSFALDGVDRYSTGQIDTMGWIKKGFVFRTDSTQTTATLSIRNNAQGGGGNDWVMDDISIATCFPSMSYSPTATPSVCAGNTIQIGDTVRSQFSNYAYYVWQRSQNNGGTWTNITTTQTAIPAINGSQYQYITTLNIPVSNTTMADSGDIYRVYTATTVNNITSPNCVANDGSAPISLSVLSCGMVLKTNLLSFNGNLMNKFAVLSWSTSQEDKPVHFELQRSDDDGLYTTIALIEGKNNGSKTNYYAFTDPQVVQDKKWYRVIMIFDNNSMKYSNAIELRAAPVDFDIANVINPFSDQLVFNIITSKSAKINAELIDMQGKIIKSASYLVYAGSNSIRMLHTDILAPGIYTLRIQNNDRVISRKVMKSNN